MILNDKQILELCSGDKPMMSPVFSTKRSANMDGEKVPSYGLNGYGYDIRIRAGTEVRVARAGKPFGNVLDPLRPDETKFKPLSVDWDHKGRRYVTLPPHSVSLACAEPYFQMPTNVIGVVQGKSTYARNGVIPLVTPLEPGWRGDLTLEFTNMTSMYVIMYLDGGVAQILFFRGDAVGTAYEGNYQDQQGLTLGRVK